MVATSWRFFELPVACFIFGFVLIVKNLYGYSQQHKRARAETGCFVEHFLLPGGYPLDQQARNPSLHVTLESHLHIRIDPQKRELEVEFRVSV